MNLPAPPGVPIVPRSELCQSDCRKHSLAMGRNAGLGSLYTQMPRQVASSVLAMPISSCWPLPSPQEASWQTVLPILRCIYPCTGAFTSANNDTSRRMGCLMRHMLDTERREGRAVVPWAGDGCEGEEKAVPAGAPRSGEADDEPSHPFELFFSFSSFRFNASRRL